MGVGPVDIDFVEERESNTVSLNKLFDFFGRSRFLFAKLIAGKSQNREPFVAKLLLELLKLGVVHVGQTSLRGHVDHQTHLTPVSVQRQVFQIDVLSDEVVERVGLDVQRVFLEANASGGEGFYPALLLL